MRWAVTDSLYCPESYFASHLDSYTHYLREAGEAVAQVDLNGCVTCVYVSMGEPEVLFQLDRYEQPWWDCKVKIAQVAAICSPMPWEVRKPDGSPAYDCVISSIPWMVEAARAAGCRGEYLPLAFDTRARVCGMGVKRDLGAIFIGSVGPNHQRRAQLLAELADVVTVLPPVFGREYFKTLARAKVVFNVHAEWARGAANNMRIFEATGMGAQCLSDGGDLARADLPGQYVSNFDLKDHTPREQVLKLLSDYERYGHRETGAATLVRHTYESRIPRLIQIAKDLLERK